MTLYGILGVNQQATQIEITQAYRKKALLCHPDKHTLEPLEIQNKYMEKFKQLQSAYAILSNPTNRKKYDAGEIDDSGNPIAFQEEMAEIMKAQISVLAKLVDDLDSLQRIYDSFEHFSDLKQAFLDEVDFTQVILSEPVDTDIVFDFLKQSTSPIAKLAVSLNTTQHDAFKTILQFIVSEDVENFINNKEAVKSLLTFIKSKEKFTTVAISLWKFIKTPEDLVFIKSNWTVEKHEIICIIANLIARAKAVADLDTLEYGYQDLKRQPEFKQLFLNYVNFTKVMQHDIHYLKTVFHYLRKTHNPIEKLAEALNTLKDAHVDLVLTAFSANNPNHIIHNKKSFSTLLLLVTDAAFKKVVMQLLPRFYKTAEDLAFIKNDLPFAKGKMINRLLKYELKPQIIGSKITFFADEKLESGSKGLRVTQQSLAKVKMLIDGLYARSQENDMKNIQQDFEQGMKDIEEEYAEEADDNYGCF